MDFLFYYRLGDIRLGRFKKNEPEWEDVQKAMDLLIEKEYIDCNKDTEVFNEFSLISMYIMSQKVTEWNNPNVSTKDFYT